jgi:hypothetical protein
VSCAVQLHLIMLPWRPRISCFCSALQQCSDVLFDLVCSLRDKVPEDTQVQVLKDRLVRKLRAVLPPGLQQFRNLCASLDRLCDGFAGTAHECLQVIGFACIRHWIGALVAEETLRLQLGFYLEGKAGVSELVLDIIAHICHCNWGHTCPHIMCAVVR